jgi:hypothetical protein
MSTPAPTETEAFLMRENQRLLVEVRVLREWVLQLAAARGATSQEDMDARHTRLEEQFETQVATQLAITLENIETQASPALAAQLDDRTPEEVLKVVTASPS